VVLQRLAEDLPADRVDWPVLPRIDHERVAVWNSGPHITGAVGERIDDSLLFEGVPVVVAPMEEPAGLQLVEEPTRHAHLRERRIHEPIEPRAGRPAAVIDP